jgi:phage-related protein
VAEIVLYADARGREPVLDYIERLAHTRPAEAAAIERYIDRLAEQAELLGMPSARIIDKGRRIYELRPGAHRIAYSQYGGRFVLLHAWRKKGQKLDRGEANIAASRLNDWIRNQERSES